MSPVDLAPAAETLAALVEAVPSDALGDPTPCAEYTLGDLVDHVGGLALAFTAAARKAGGERVGPPPLGDAGRLAPDWREHIPRDVRALAVAWHDPSAWTGTTTVGGVDLPGAAAGIVALDELVVHGWDVARALERPYPSDPASIDAVAEFLAGFAAPDPDAVSRLFAAPIVVPDGAPALDRVLGLTGRDPAWSPGVAPSG